VFIGYFTERPYQDPSSGYFGRTGRSIEDLSLSNRDYNPKLGAELYNRYLDEKVYAEQMGFDGLMLNEHHSTPFCMGGVMNVEAAILARITTRAKIVLLGNVLPIWEDPLWLAEMLAEIDMISRGRLVAGWVRGTGRESVAHNSQPPFNWERFQEAHDFIVKAWTTPGPFRWEGEHYNYRYVNPWARPYQEPHPPIWIPGVMSRNTVAWAAKHRYPYVMLATELEPTKQSLDYYNDVAREEGYEAGTQHRGYLFKVHVDETEELAEAAGRKYIEGPSNPFLEGNQGDVRPFIQNLPGMTSRTNLLPTLSSFAQARARGRLQEHEAARGTPAPKADYNGSYEDQIQKMAIITGTPDTVIPKVRHVLEYLRPGNIFLWDGDGAMSHDDAMRSLRLMGEEVIPAVREMSKELDLKGAFEVDPITNQPIDQAAPA
jgi:alkanesulfonate monooxygenase SsuD/methylene tetrahydromethanopterin reductase-like flavin-dependent oxidoreductase (luciferase family)